MAERAAVGLAVAGRAAEDMVLAGSVAVEMAIAGRAAVETAVAGRVAVDMAVVGRVALDMAVAGRAVDVAVMSALRDSVVRPSGSVENLQSSVCPPFGICCPHFGICCPHFGICCPHFGICCHPPFRDMAASPSTCPPCAAWAVCACLGGLNAGGCRSTPL